MAGLTFNVFGHDVSAAKTIKGIEGQATKSSGKIRESFKDIGKSLLTGAGIVGLGELGKKSLEAADQLEGSNIKIEHVFGESSDAVEAWAGSLASSFGISQAAAEATAGSFAQILVPLGKNSDETAAMSEKLVTLTADMARFNNADPAAVQSALIAGLRGRATALRSYGVDLSATAVKEEASRLGLVKKGEALSDSAKTQAAYNLILKDTKRQEGAVADTSKTLAQQKQILSAQVENLEAKLGTVLMPVLTALAGYLTRDVIPAFSTVGHWVKQNTSWLVPLAVAVGSAAVAYKLATFGMAAYKATMAAGAAVSGLLTGATEAQTVAQGELDAAMDANPIALIVAALAALAVGLVYAWKHSERFRDIVKAVWTDIKTVIMAVWDHWLKPQFEAFKAIMTTTASVAVSLWHGMETVAHGIAVAWHGVGTAFGDVWGFIHGVYDKIKSGIHTVHDVIAAVVGKIKTVFSSIGGAIKTAWDVSFGPILTAIKASVDAVIHALQELGILSISGQGSLSGALTVGAGTKAPKHNAHGGMAFAGVPMVVGDGGRPEEFVPPSNGQILPNVPRGGSAPTVVNVHFGAGVILGSPAEVGRAVVQAVEHASNAGVKIPASAVR